MNAGMFQSTTIPLLEQVVDFTESRHTVLAGNIANLDTPGYQVRDLSVEDFQKQLRSAIENRHQSSDSLAPDASSSNPDTQLAQVAKNSKSIMLHDKSNVGLEYQVTEMAKNQMQHNLALAILAQQFRQLQTAISGRL